MIVVKLGGNVVGGSGLATVAEDIVALRRDHEVLVVHGGGPQTTALMERIGLPVVKVAGRRVTDERTLACLLMAVGQVNAELCAALLGAGGRPVGLHGASDAVIEATRRPPQRYPGHAEPADLGLVGDVTALNLALLRLLVDGGYLPVLACVGASRSGQLYNINADVVANEIAARLEATALVLVSDIVGVLRDVKDVASRIPVIDEDTGRRLIEEGVVSEGMIPKLEESFDAIRRGVGRVHIMGADEPGALVRELAEPGSVGTSLVATAEKPSHDVT